LELSLQYLIEFITHDDITQTKIYEQLKCSLEEANILKFLAQKYISGFEDVSVLEILQENFGGGEYAYLRHLPTIKNLIDLGWLTQVDFGVIKNQDNLHLEILVNSVTPSVVFLKLLEEGTLEIALPDIKPYTDHLEYLQDQFDLIELFHKIASYRHNFKENSINRLKNKITLLSNRIDERIKATEEPIVVEEFFDKNAFEENQKIIFLALLKEEYSGGEGKFRDMNALIDLISDDDYQRIKNRALLEDGSKLITENIIDYEEVLTPFGGISRSFYIQDEIMQQIIHPNKKKKVSKLKLDMLVKEQEIFEYLEPKTTLEDVVLHDDTRKVLETVQKQVDRNVFKKLKEWGIKDSNRRTIDAKIIFYGVPGTGKTMTAMSLAKSLKKPILSFDCSKILSMYVGESEKNVRKIFDDFKELSSQAKVDPILLLNEADQFLSSRSEGAGGSAEKMHNQMQNIFLEQIEKFEGILIATTNLLDNIDKAFSRRFNYKVEFKKPEFKQRIRLWQFMLPESADYEEGFDVEMLSKYELTGGQINLIIKNTAYKVAVRDESIFGMQDFLDEISKELGSNFDKNISMGFKI
jgi:SpoVK/Ycf46/Vps4 family AAA+-type ATPase